MLRYVKVAKKKEEPDALSTVGPAAAAAGVTTAVGNVAQASNIEKMFENADKETPLTSKQMKGLRKNIGAKHVPVVEAGAAAKARGAVAVPPHIPRSANKGKGLGGMFSKFVVDQVTEGGDKPDPTRAARTGFAAVPGGEKGAPSMVAHEMGHLSGKSKRFGLRNKTYARIVPRMQALAKPAGAVAGFLSSAKADGKDQGAVKETARGGAYGAAAGLAAASPNLFEEGRASVRAVRGLKSVGVRGKALRAVKGTLTRGFGSYAGAAALGGAALGMVGSGAGRYKRESDKAKA